MSIIDEIKKRLSIVDALETYTNANLTKSKTFKKQFNICCPWHHDKTPSLTIYIKSNQWRCQAGCGSGDVINLVSKALSISNKETIKLLKKQLGIKYVAPTIEDTYRQYDRKILQGFQQTKEKISLELMHLRTIFNLAMKEVASFEDIDKLVEVYHFKPLIQKYLEELYSDDFEIQVATVKYLKPLFQEVNV